MPAAALHALHWPEDGGGGEPSPAVVSCPMCGWQIVLMTATSLLLVLVPWT